MQAGKVGNVAGFFVEAVRAKYTDNKQKNKQTDMDKKEKLAEMKRVEEESVKKMKESKQAIYEKEMQIFNHLIQEDQTLIQKLIDIISVGMSATYYQANKSFEENMVHPLLKAAFLNAAKDVASEVFRL